MSEVYNAAYYGDEMIQDGGRCEVGEREPVVAPVNHETTSTPYA